MKNTVKSAIVSAAVGVAVLCAAGVATAQDSNYPPTTTPAPTTTATPPTTTIPPTVLPTEITRTPVTTDPTDPSDPTTTQAPAPTVLGTEITRAPSSTVSSGGAVQGDDAVRGTGSQGGLAFTGADVIPVGIGGGALVLLGAGALLVARKRKH